MVDNSGDVVNEFFDQGNDTVYASINYLTPADVENAVLTGGAITATGNALNNVLVGNALGNSLVGGAGNDLLAGGAGNDLLVAMSGRRNDNHAFYGGPGNDILTIDGGPGDDIVEGGMGIDLVAGAVQMLGSSDASGLTGTVLRATGGRA